MDWILCKERLPEINVAVLVTIAGSDILVPQAGETLEACSRRLWEEVRYVEIAYLGEDGWNGNDGFPLVVGPLAWMPLPEAYRGGEL